MFLHSPTHNAPTHMCWVCGKDVDLTHCKTDEHGSIVHELCYAAKNALANGSITRGDTTPTQTDSRIVTMVDAK